MQASALTIAEIRNLVVERARNLDDAITLDRVDIYEDPFAADGDTLIIQIASKRPADARIWTEKRLRFAQSIRDLLLENGEDRYPVLQFFGPDEWAGRND